MPLISALWRQRQVDLHEFEVSLVYKASFRTARTVTQRNPVSNFPPRKSHIGYNGAHIESQHWEAEVGGWKVSS